KQNTSAVAARPILQQQENISAVSRVFSWVRLFEPRSEGGHLPPCLFQTHSRTQPADHVEDMHAAAGHPGMGVDCEGYPQLDLAIREKEPGRHNSHDVELNIIDADRVAGQAGMAAKATLPQLMA